MRKYSAARGGISAAEARQIGSDAAEWIEGVHNKHVYQGVETIRHLCKDSDDTSTRDGQAVGRDAAVGIYGLQI